MSAHVVMVIVSHYFFSCLLRPSVCCICPFVLVSFLLRELKTSRRQMYPCHLETPRSKRKIIRLPPTRKNMSSLKNMSSWLPPAARCCTSSAKSWVPRPSLQHPIQFLRPNRNRGKVSRNGDPNKSKQSKGVAMRQLVAHGRTASVLTLALCEVVAALGKGIVPSPKIPPPTAALAAVGLPLVPLLGLCEHTDTSGRDAHKSHFIDPLIDPVKEKGIFW